MSADPVVNLKRCDVIIDPANPTPTRYVSARFVYLKGRAAVWLDNKATRTSTRVAYSDSASVELPRTARNPVIVTTSTGAWEVKQQNGGCGCGSPTKNIPLSKLLDPEFSSI